MTDRDDGGPAFACASEWGVGEAPFVQEGMSLRDYFAGQVVAGIRESDRCESYPHAAEQAYRLADAMIKARSK